MESAWAALDNNFPALEDVHAHDYRPVVDSQLRGVLDRLGLKGEIVSFEERDNGSHRGRIAVAHDAGTILNPQAVEGQIEGGVIMGLGYATMEKMVWDDKGRLLTPNFRTYLIPTALDAPPVKAMIVEEPEPTGPFGAKGTGEPPACPTAAALINAIYDAVGVTISSLPVTAEKVYQALKIKSSKERERSLC